VAAGAGRRKRRGGVLEKSRKWRAGEDALRHFHDTWLRVIPAKAGTHLLPWRHAESREMDPRFRGDDED